MSAPASTLKSLKIYAFTALIAAWPLLNFAISNAHWLSASENGFLIVASVIVGVVLLFLISLWILIRMFGSRHAIRLTFFTGSVALILFSYQPLTVMFEYIFAQLGILLTPPYGYGLMFVFVPLVLLATLNRKPFLDFAFVFSLIAVAVSAVELATLIGARGNDEAPVFAGRAGRESAPETGPPLSPSTTDELAFEGMAGRPDLPNIYHILADQYARNDQLMAILGYNNGAFTTALEERGFRVLTEAKANYPETAFSFSSMFSMDYPFTETAQLPDTMRHIFTPVDNVNAVIKMAWDLGYEYAHIGTNIWGLTQCPSHDRIICLTPDKSDLSVWEVEIIDAINRMTPFSYFVSINSRLGEEVSIENVTESVTGISLDNPLLLFAHTMQPHSPYTRKADCSRQSNVQFSLTGPNDPGRYVEAVQCVNKMLLAFADAISKRDPNAIVIFSSDHGSKFTLDQAAWTGVWSKRQFEERYSVLLAIKGPERCIRGLSDDFTLVNIYRWAFACAQGREADLLESRFYDVNYDAFTTGEKGSRKVYRFPDGGPLN